jgi:hypothetical protein
MLKREEQISNLADRIVCHCRRPLWVLLLDEVLSIALEMAVAHQFVLLQFVSFGDVAFGVDLLPN